MGLAIAQSSRPSARADAAPAPPPPAPGVVDTLGAGFRVAMDEIDFVQESRLNRAYVPVVQALRDINGKRVADYGSGLFGGHDAWDADKIWQDVSAARAADPAAFKDLPATRAEFERQTLTRSGGRAADRDTVARGNAVAGFVGGVGAQVFDPFTVATTIATGGGGATMTFARKVLFEAGANAAAEAAQITVGGGKDAIEALGEDLGAGEIALRIGMAAGFGAAVPAAGKALDLGRGQFEKSVAANWDRLPAGLRDRWAARSTIAGSPGEDALVADMAEALVGRDRMTEQESAALAVLRRDADVAQANPFVPDGTGVAAHQDRLAAALADLGELPQPLSVATRLRTGTAPAAPAIARAEAPSPGFDLARYMGRNRSAESGGSDVAAAATSSAYGRYQFLKETWVANYKATFGDTGESREAILRKRADGAVQDRVMRTFTEGNVRILKGAGVPVDDASVYLAHFLGTADAIKVLRAAGDAPIAGLVRDASRNANRAVFDKISSAGDLRAWARRKMGRPAAAADIEPARTADVLPEEDASIAIDRARLDDDRDAFARADDEPAAVVREDVLHDALVPMARGLVEDRGQSLKALPQLAEQLGIGEQDLRRAFDTLVDRGELRRTASGLYRRAPSGSGGPEDMLKFISRRGGLSFDGLNDAGRKLGTAGHDLRNSGNLKAFVPGAGPLLRKNGRSLDEMGELLHDAGYFGPPETTPRPTEGELITLLDDVIRRKEKRYSNFDQAPVARSRDIDPEEERAHWNAVADHVGLQGLSDQEIGAVLQLMDAGTDVLPPLRYATTRQPEELAPYLVAMVNREIDDALEDVFQEFEDPFYDQFADALARQDQPPGRGGEGSAPDAGNQGARAAGARTEQGSASKLTPAQLDDAEAEGLLGAAINDPAAGKAFDDPTGDGAQAAAESIWHDLRATDPGIAARQAQEAQLGADAPLRGQNKTGQAQDGEMGLGLFDAANQPKFDLGDGKGERTIAEIDAELEADAKAIDTIESCMRDVPGEGGDA